MFSDIKSFFSEYSAISTKASRVPEYEIFFRQFSALTANKLKGLEKFFYVFAPIAQRIHAERKKQAPRFNIFEALQIHEDEVLTSKFLSYLLDPREHHDQGTIFLRSFLEFVLGETKHEDVAQRARVTPERWAGSYGRLDIAIEFPDGQIILVENKINAEERPKQIEDYQTWLSLQKGDGHAVVFLTPDGRLPITSKSDGIRIFPLSYSKLVDWLISVPVPDRIAVIVRQFCENFA